MKLKLLAAVAYVAFISTGVAAMAQDAPKHDQERPAAERAEPRAPAAAPKNEGAPRAAQMERRDNADTAGRPANEPPRAAQTERKEQPGEAMNPAPKAAQSEERKEQPKAAQSQERKEAPRAAQSEPRKDAGKAAEMERKGEPRAGEAKPESRPPRAADAQGERDRKPGAEERDRNTNRAAERGAPKVMGNVKISNEHATRVSEALRRDARPERVDIDVRVGVRVPETVVVRPLPPEVVTLVPEYRGYDYFVDSEDEIVFVSPETHEIVGSIDYEGRAASEEGATRVSAARPCPTED